MYVNSRNDLSKEECKKDTDDMNTRNFLVDYSIKGTAKCRECKTNIEKGQLRIGKLVHYKLMHYYQYRHVKCAFKSFNRARTRGNVITNINDINGTELLTLPDMAYICDLIRTENKNRKILPELTKRKKPCQKDTTHKDGTNKAKQSNLPNIPILFTNADQLTTSKMTELRNRIKVEKPLIIGICEVKPKNSKKFDIRDFDIPEYTMHPVNLEASTPVLSSRGIIVYTHKSIDNSVIEYQQESFEEACLIAIRLRGGDKLVFGCFYRSPTQSDTSKKNNEELNKLIESISSRKHSHLCLVGDFNFRDINWTSWTTHHNEDSAEWKFINSIQNSFLYQHVENTTRRRGNNEPSLLDLIFTNERLHISEIKHHAPLGKSDHDVITFNYHSYLDFSEPKTRFLYEKADYESMRKHLQSLKWKDDFVSNTNHKSIEMLWENIKTTIMSLRDSFVPKTKQNGKPKWKEKGTVPIDANLQMAIKDKRKTHKKWSKCFGDATEHRMAYSKANNKVKRLMRKAKRNFEKDIASKSDTHPKFFWSYVRSKLKTKTGVAPLLANPKDKNSTVFTDEEKANKLQEQFCSVFTNEPVGQLPQFEKKTNNYTSQLVVTEDMVRAEIKNLNLNKTCGPDEIHPRMLAELCEELVYPLTLLFQRTVKEGIIPGDWRKANVTPIYKKGAKNLAENYRPISLTSIVCKIMEKIVKDSLLKHLVDNDLLSTKQFGFLPGRSTILQLLKYLDECLETVATGGVIDAIYLDFAKAFDKVPHRRLMQKLEAYGIIGKTLGWIKAFLSDRSQRVVVNNDESIPGKVISGVPQGSVLGPLLFVIFINDLPGKVKSNVYLFADDTKIAKAVSTAEDALHLQDDLNRLLQWSRDWLLEFNLKKCHVLTLGRLDNITHTHNYTMDNHKLEHVFDEKDLGVTIDFEMNFDEHISNKIRIANAIMGLIRRGFAFLDEKMFRKLYVTFVRPHLEYGQVIWSPHYMRQINMIENVQKRATCLVDGFQNLDYPQRLTRLNLPTLSERRTRGDMIEIWKHFHVYERACLSKSFKPRERVSRQHRFQLIHNRPKDGIRGVQRNSFYHRATDSWNSLPASVVESNTINKFKNALDEHWKTS